MNDATTQTENPRQVETTTPTGSTASPPPPLSVVEWVLVSELVREAYPVPARPIEMPQEDGTDPDKIDQLANRIRATSRFDPIQVDEGLRVLDGRRRHAAAILLGWERVPVQRINGLSEEQKWAWAWTQAARREFSKVPRAEREAMTRDALRRLHRYSDAYVSGLVAESERTVAERRAAMIDAGEIPDHRRLMGLDGKSYTVKTRAQRAAAAEAEVAERERQRAEFEKKREEADQQRQEAERKMTPEEKAERERKEQEEQEERDAYQLKTFVLDKKEPVVAEVPDGVGPLPAGRYLVRVREGHPGPLIRGFGYSGIIDLYPPAAPAGPPVEQPPAEPSAPPPDAAPPAEPQNSPAEASVAGQKVTPATKQTARSKDRKK